MPDPNHTNTGHSDDPDHTDNHIDQMLTVFTNTGHSDDMTHTDNHVNHTNVEPHTNTGHSDDPDHTGLSGIII